MKENTNRNMAFDILRIISAISIVVMHISSQSVYSLQINSAGFNGAVIINSISHFGVPVFVMISGALFMHPDRKLDLKRLWLHNILRMFIIFILWSFIYGFIDHLRYRGDIKELLWSCVISRNHLWFLPMIIGIYIILPIILRWVRNAKEKEIRLFILLFFVFQIICETINAFEAAEIIAFALDYRNIEIICSYVGYFIIGHYIANIGLKDKTRKLIYVLGIIGCFAGTAVVFAFSILRNEPAVTLVDSFSIFTFLYSVALFTFVYNLFGKKEYKGWLPSFISNVSKDTLGLYLSHLLIIEKITVFGDISKQMPVVSGIIVYTALVFIVGIAGSGLLRRIPFVGRYIC